MINTMRYTLIVLAIAAEASAAQAQMMRTTVIPPETIKTSAYYDSTSHKLTVTCDVASRGLCKITVVDGPRSKVLDLKSNTRVTIGNVSSKARVCAVGRNEGQVCSWALVES